MELGPVDPSSSLPEGAPEAPSIDRESSAIGLRLAIGREGLGIELARSTSLECVEVVELVVRLPHVRFPFDVTGGVGRFRHKRGQLERVAVEIDARRAARWAEPRVRGLLSAGSCSVSIVPRRTGATVTIVAPSPGLDPSAAEGVAIDRRSEPGAALAFEVALAEAGDDLALVVFQARGVNLKEPATTLALRAVTALVSEHAAREGARFLFRRAAASLARRLLPDAGVRAPEAEGLVLSGAGESDGVLFLAFARGAVPLEGTEEAARAVEGALLTREGDDARLRRELDRARACDLSALERAPRHPEIARRIAELDWYAGGRAEAALATLRDAGVAGGPLRGELLVEAGEQPSAIASWLAEAERETSPMVSALTYARAAELATDASDALRWLDSAVARAPRLAELRWDRARRRIRAGRLADARADFQELEALCPSRRERHDMLRRAADLYRAVGLSAEAMPLYQRALLYRPDDPVALAGLGVSLALENRAVRAAALLSHAIERAGRVGISTNWMEVELARVLGEHLEDRPAAIARLRSVPDSAHEAIAARGLEGRFRAELGDEAGASLAFARLRERAGREPAAVPWLVEAAAFEEGRGELAVAQQHLGAALAIVPGDAAVSARFRRIGEAVAAKAGIAKPAPPPPPPGQQPQPPSEPRPEPEPESEPESERPFDEAGAEARVEALTRTLQGDPSNDAVVDELAMILMRLGRGMELLALLSARLEDALPERRAELLPKHRAVLEQLEREAREAGRGDEADLFKMARESS